MLLRILAAKNLAGVPLTVQYINYEGKILPLERVKLNVRRKRILLQFSWKICHSVSIDFGTK